MPQTVTHPAARNDRLRAALEPGQPEGAVLEALAADGPLLLLAVAGENGDRTDAPEEALLRVAEAPGGGRALRAQDLP